MNAQHIKTKLQRYGKKTLKHISEDFHNLPNYTLLFCLLIVFLISCSSGMTCPAADFVEEPFLLAVKDALSEQGLFIINLVTRSPTINDMVVTRMKGVSINILKRSCVF